jgi:hypothetical protein
MGGLWHESAGVQDAIGKQLSVADICPLHHVTGRTVAVVRRPGSGDCSNP